MTDDLPPLVLYHGACADGFAASWVMWRKFGPNAVYRPIQYGDHPPDDAAARDVYLLDFAFDHSDPLRRLASFAKHLTIVDHHQSSREAVLFMQQPEWRDKVTAIHDQGKSGGMLTWELIFPDRKTPWLIDYTQDRDLWRYQLPDSKEVNAFLRSCPFDFRLWDAWDDQVVPGGLRWDGIVREGEAILRDHRQKIDQAVQSYFMICIDGHTVPCVNATCLHSEIGHALCQGHPFAATFFDTPTHRVWSFRSDKNGLDVSEIARKFGGGGHKHAAGFHQEMRFGSGPYYAEIVVTE